MSVPASVIACFAWNCCCTRTIAFIHRSTSANSRLAKFVGPMVIIFLFTAQRQVLLEPNPDGFVPKIPGRNRWESHVVSTTSEEPNEPSMWRRFVSVLVSVLSLIAHLFSSFARFVFDVLVAGLFYHSGKAALIAIVAVSCFPASVMGAVYVTLAVLVALSSALSGGHPVDTDKPLFVRVWLPWLLLAACFLVAKYVYQAALFAPANGNHWFTAGNSSIWWGLPEPLTGDPTFADSWYVFREPFVIIVVCSLLRASCELLPLVKAERYSFIRQLQVRTGPCSPCSFLYLVRFWRVWLCRLLAYLIRIPPKGVTSLRTLTRSLPGQKLGFRSWPALG